MPSMRAWRQIWELSGVVAEIKGRLGVLGWALLTVAGIIVAAKVLLVKSYGVLGTGLLVLAAIVFILGVLGLIAQSGGNNNAGPPAEPPQPPPVTPSESMAERVSRRGTLSPPNQAAVDAAKAILQDEDQQPPKRPSNLARMAVEAEKGSAERGKELLKRHYRDGQALQRRLRTPRFNLFGSKGVLDTWWADFQELLAWHRRLNKLIDQYEPERKPEFRVSLDSLKGYMGVASKSTPGKSEAMALLDENLWALRMLLIDRGVSV